MLVLLLLLVDAMPKSLGVPSSATHQSINQLALSRAGCFLRADKLDGRPDGIAKRASLTNLRELHTFYAYSVPFGFYNHVNTENRFDFS